MMYKFTVAWDETMKSQEHLCRTIEELNYYDWVVGIDDGFNKGKICGYYIATIYVMENIGPETKQEKLNPKVKKPKKTRRKKKNVRQK